MNERLDRLRRRAFLIILIGLIGLGATAIYGYTTNDSYQATSRLFVATAATDVTQANQGNLAGQARVKTYMSLVTGLDLLARAAQKSGTGRSGGEVAGNLSVLSPPGTVLVDITVTDPDASAAAKIANAVSTELVDLVNRIEEPLDGGDPSLGLLVIQPAESSVVKTPRYDVMSLAIGSVVGLVVGFVIALALPDRVRWSALRRRKGPNTGTRATEDA
jgi:capsular polysaccharide biosynthesis protein